MNIIKIPKDRIGALIGPKGATKRDIETRTGATLVIDSKEGEVMIDTERVEDPLMALKVVGLVRAIGRGFSPEKAYRLLRDEMYFQLIDIRDYTGKSSKRIRRMKGRLIGTDGRTRELIEELSEADIVVYGHTVGIIGDFTTVDIAKTAVDMILNGSEHSTVYKFLEQKRRQQKTMRFIEGV